ncbi:MAG: DEAD/DEAH box helicase family protein, partial [Legionellales bacterium]|nr:DEAD/DEAH box helicase family protein [Legionellales bacterium]
MEKHRLLEHQKQAVKAINKAAQSHDRTQINMACGTGKTLVGLQYALKSKAKNILVLLPSLGLMKQTLEYWLVHSDWSIDNFMCVCSDPSVTRHVYDETIINYNEFACSVSTNVIDVKTFLRKRAARSHNIIFCTYQSADIVSKSMPRDFMFDLGVFDEAHKTAGNKDKHFSLGLDDNNIKIDFRLFMTATPKHYRIKKKDDFDNKELAYSMDNRNLYGDVCYKFSFTDAIRQNIICDFKIIISVIESNEIDRLKLRASKMDDKDNDTEAVKIAHRLALADGLKKHKINKIISFHSRVSEAKEFICYANNKYFSELDKFNILHVNGKMSSGDRHKVIDDFRDSKKGMLTNARCLTEGVDVPAVDCVAFLSPKKSSIDIIQAVGRAMRKYKDKTLGYVFIPLYLNSSKNEDISIATEITGFDYAVDILNALKEYDPAFSKIIVGTMNNFGQTREFDFNKLKSKLSVIHSGKLNTEILQKVISTKIVNKISSSWDYRYGQLQFYKKNHGHCNVPRHYKDNPELGRWVWTQRDKYNKIKLTAERI